MFIVDYLVYNCDLHCCVICLDCLIFGSSINSVVHILVVGGCLLVFNVVMFVGCCLLFIVVWVGLCLLLLHV